MNAVLHTCTHWIWGKFGGFLKLVWSPILLFSLFLWRGIKMQQNLKIPSIFWWAPLYSTVERRTPSLTDNDHFNRHLSNEDITLLERCALYGRYNFYWFCIVYLSVYIYVSSMYNTYCIIRWCNMYIHNLHSSARNAK